MEPAVVTALITAATALLLAVWNSTTLLASQRHVEHLKADLGEWRAAQDARRDYEYEARKRLYDQLEPIRFQFAGAADSAYARIADLARAAQRGNLDPPDNWLSAKGDAYFLLSTVYRLLAPLAILRLAQRALTLVDLRLDQDIKYWYIISRKVALTFSDDFNLAQAAPALDYRPVDERRRKSRDIRVHSRQGVYIGRVEAAADSLLTRDQDAPRLMTFGEFEASLRSGAEPLTGSLRPFFDILTDFHPGRRPVTWRILIAQAHLYRVALHLKGVDPAEDPEWRRILLLPAQERVMFEWGDPDGGGSSSGTHPTDDPLSAVIEPLAVALDRSVDLYKHY